MSLDSFYGGKQGVSPVVKARFKYVDTNDPAYIAAKNLVANEADLKDDTMELCFKDSDYTQVWYGQLCIIDTTNKRNPNNGKLFRRVLPRLESTYEEGGTPNAEYIGRIIGPAEGYPTVRFGSLQKMAQKAQEDYDGNSDIVFPIDADGTVVDSYITSDEVALKEEGKPGKIHILKATYNKLDEDEEPIAEPGINTLVPGATKDENGNWKSYETGINYSWVNIRNNIKGQDQESYVYLGFEIPYTVFDFQISDISWYEDGDQELINEDDYLSGKQPFFQNWKIEIPRGMPGHYASCLRRTTTDEFCNWNSDSEKILYNFDDIEVYSSGEYLLPSYGGEEPSYPNFNVADGSSIIVYTYTFFDRDATGYKKTINCFLGQLKDLSEIVLDEHGFVTVKYSDMTQAKLNEDHPLKWIESVTFHPKGENTEEPDNWGYITVTYNTIDPDNPEDSESGVHSHETAEFYLHLIDKVRTGIDPENPDHGVIEVKYKDQEEGDWEKVEDFSYKFIDDVKVEKDTKELLYHANPNVNGFMSFADPVYLNAVEETYIGVDGNLYVKYSSSKYRVNPEDDELGSPWIDNLSQDPPLYFYFDEKGREWRKGGFLPDANDEEPVWWLNLGNIVKYDAHVKIVQELQWDRFAKIQGYASAEEMNSERFSREEILDILNSSEIDKNTPDKYKWVYNDIDYNPYANGHIFAFPPPVEGEDPDLIPNERHSDDFKGQLVFANHMAFYYDYNTGRWKYAGPWGGDPDKAPAKVISEDKEEPFIPGVADDVEVNMNYYGFYFGTLGDKEQDSELEDLGLIYEDKEVEPDDEEDTSLQGTAYAILDSDGTLTFFRSENEYTAGADQTVTDIEGNSYTGQVYTGVETQEGIEYNSAPWFNQKSNIRLAKIADNQIIAPISCAYWFSICPEMTAFEGIERLDTSSVTSMAGMFYGCNNAVFNPDVSNLDTSNITNMSSMFEDCSGAAFNPDVSGWNTSNVTNMSYMFDNCSGAAFNPNVSGWNTSNVTNMSYMFSSCTGAAFNPDVSNWDTSNVTDMSGIFSQCSGAAFNPDVSNWNTSKVTNMMAMFSGCSGIASNFDLSNWDISNVMNMNGIFSNCSNLTTIYVAPETNWAASAKLTSSWGMFSGCTKLKGGNNTIYNSSYIDKTYARVDKDGQPGYFTAKPSA